MWEQLQSWQEVLPVLENFFKDKSRPLNKQQIARKYYACSQVFMLFYQDFSQTMQQLEKQLLELRSRKKVLGVQNAILVDSEGGERSF